MIGVDGGVVVVSVVGVVAIVFFFLILSYFCPKYSFKIFLYT
jgi:hypothetical protein